MKIKSYFAGTVEAAVASARIELGPDAMLMSSKRTAPDVRHLGEYEVVFATANPIQERIEYPATQESTLAADIAELKRGMERLSGSLARARCVAASNLNVSTALSSIFSQLIAADVDPTVAQELLSAMRARNPGQRDALSRLLREEIESLALADSTLGRPEQVRVAKRQVIALIGPPGAGKTTSLVKLGVRYGVSKKRPTQFLSMDTERIAAADQLHSFAAILGAGFQTVETSNALSVALEEHRNKELILIDTPGYGPRELQNTNGHVEMLSRHAEIDVHLVLSAAMKSADLVRTIDGFMGFRPHKLLFTRLDETSTFGTIFSESLRIMKPVSFLCSGQQIPEDLEPSSKGRIADLVLGEMAEKAAVAAA